MLYVCTRHFPSQLPSSIASINQSVQSTIGQALYESCGPCFQPVPKREPRKKKSIKSIHFITASQLTNDVHPEPFGTLLLRCPGIGKFRVARYLDSNFMHLFFWHLDKKHSSRQRLLASRCHEFASIFGEQRLSAMDVLPLHSRSQLRNVWMDKKCQPARPGGEIRFIALELICGVERRSMTPALWVLYDSRKSLWKGAQLTSYRVGAGWRESQFFLSSA